MFVVATGRRDTFVVQRRVADPNAEGLELLDDGEPGEKDDGGEERRMSKAEGKAEVGAQIFSKNKCVQVFCGELMLTQKLQRRFAEEEAMIRTRMDAKHVLQELSVGEFFKA